MENIDRKILKIHNYIYANEGLGNEAVLNEFLKIFYCKVLDEKRDNTLLKETVPNKIIENVEKLYKDYKSMLVGIVDEKDKINLKKETIVYMINELNDIKLTSMGSDVKGHILQKIIDRAYREGRGQFFTPAPVTDFIVKMINPKENEKGCDPASGTGGFMFRALEHISKNTNISDKQIDNIYFYDISKQLINLIAMRMMFEYSYNKPNFCVKDSIMEDFDLKFDYVLTNPPFGSQGRITNSDILKKYSLGTDDDGSIYKNQVPDILFVEKVINILKENGRAAIILPDGDFENPSQEYFRRFIVENVKILAIVSLPDGTFIPYGTGVKSSIIFIKKLPKDKLLKEIANNYEIFYGKINKLGYTFSKHSKDLLLPDGSIDEDYSELVLSYHKNKDSSNSFKIKINDVIGNKYILSETFHSPIYREVIDKLKKQKHALLKDLVDFNYKKVKLLNSEKYNYIEIADVNSYTSEIINSTEMFGEELPSRASYKLDENDLIVATSGNTIGTDKQSKAIVNNTFKGCICTNGFTVMKTRKISPYYLLWFFNSSDFLNQILKYKYGSAIPCIGRTEFENIIVPLLPEKDMKKIEETVKKSFMLREEAIKLLHSI